MAKDGKRCNLARACSLMLICVLCTLKKNFLHWFSGGRFLTFLMPELANAIRHKFVKAYLNSGVSIINLVFVTSLWYKLLCYFQFVSASLKDPSLEFELLDPVLVKRRVIPHFPGAGERGSTLEDEELVPSALIKFRPVETDSCVFTGLCNELLEISEPLNWFWSMKTQQYQCLCASGHASISQFCYSPSYICFQIVRILRYSKIDTSKLIIVAQKCVYLYS